MNLKDRKKVLKDALITSFVDDYKSYKKTVDFINEDLINYNINYQYTYDDFCIEFLNLTLKNIEQIDIFSFNDFENFYTNFWNLNLYTLKTMITLKIQELGYNNDLYNNYNIKKINDKNENKANK